MSNMSKKKGIVSLILTVAVLVFLAYTAVIGIGPTQTGAAKNIKLGLDLEKGEVPQVLVPKGMIFGSAMEEEGFSLVGCMVSPCFKYEEFELFDRKELLEKYPEHREVILRLTRE